MSKTLHRLLTGVLTGQRPRFRVCDPATQVRVGEALNLVPMSLSSRQQEAIRNAWSSDISYIQGPPGTGKSHTISALMLSALILEKRVLLGSHKKAAIDVVRAHLAKQLGDDAVIYIGADTAERQRTRMLLTGLIAEVRRHDFPTQLAEIRRQEQRASDALLGALRQAEQTKRTLAAALGRVNGAYLAMEEHLRARSHYDGSFGTEDLTADLLARTPEIPASLANSLTSMGDLMARRAGGEEVTTAELLRARVLLASYQRSFGAKWITTTPWDVHRLQAHHRAVAAFAQSREQQRHLLVDVNRLRAAWDDQRSQVEHLSRAHLRILYKRIRLTNAATCVDDLSNFAALFRLRAPRLIRPIMEQINYAAITKVFPLWLGEMRNLGTILPFQEDIFDVAVVDEASQVNIAEVVPMFYRAQSFVVVGDRKQLGLEAAGLFSINKTFEQLAWNNSFGGMSGVIDYQTAKQRDITVSTSSILDFLVSPTNGLSVPQATLDEHYRSLPPLAGFTSSQFYEDDGGLKIMTEVPENLGKECFRLIEVGGSREEDGKYVIKEVDEALRLVSGISSGAELGNGSPLRYLGFRSPDRFPSVGIISFTTSQRDVLRMRAEAEIDEPRRRTVQLFIGTPEEFQGNERDVMILTFGLGEGGSRYAASFYEKPTRFNVATSRAKKFTYAVIGQCPPSAKLLRSYFGRFGFHPAMQTAPEMAPPEAPDLEQRGTRMLWRLDERRCESGFEKLLLDCLRSFMDLHGGRRLKLFNQVTTCGQKRLDFVLHDDETAKAVAIEVDGPDHFCADGKTYHQEHMDRVGVLRRAGWQIVHVPYHRWYRNGWLYGQRDVGFAQTLEEFYSSLRTLLGIRSQGGLR